MAKRAAGTEAGAPPILEAGGPEDDGRVLAIPAYTEPHHITRIIAERGGPWSEMVVSRAVADAEMSRILAKGYDLIYADHITVVPDGIYFMWVVAKPVGHPGQGLKQIWHITHPIAAGAGAEPPALTAFHADRYLQSHFDDGWRLFRFKPIAVDPSGITVMWILVR